MQKMITTLTLNPAYDVHVTIDEFRPEHENLAESVTRDVGGKGINISRALSENNINNTAIILLGSDNGADFVCGLEKTGLNYKTIQCAGRIRENITIHPSIGQETRLSFKGFTCNLAHLEAVEKMINSGDTVTFTGSLPPGISAESAEAFLLRLKANGCRLVIDSKSVTLEMLRRIKPWLIKPNLEEIETYFGSMDEKQLCQTALELHRDGIANVMISLGEDGAILAADDSLYRAHVPQIDVRSTIGAGDSAIAGFISRDATPDECLRLAVAYGSAACLRAGTNPPLTKDILAIYQRVNIERT